ncbi:D-alanyl-D-alanine carboxypeptidase [Pediococcus damnosus]|nr:D-alanyl-D-alanine carboxypeptidase family protein [Pediococcus damnosus]KRN53911.1 D-alanyl-D-alanine carboxypeptidase [Pediococcus damnosus]PJE49259.1 D-alanyl-D-alanine carboxypeptidase [Pediococcus damnosus]
MKGGVLMFNKWKQKLAIIFSMILMLSAMALAPVQAQAANVNISAKAGIAVDAQTGQILYSKNSSKVLPIASMSKMLSIYIILKSIHEGKLKWDQRVHISDNVAKISRNKELTNVVLNAKRTYTVRDLYKASLIYSANAAVIALGVTQAGSSEKFVNEMRSQVKAWGITDAKIYNAAGLTEGEVGTEAYPNTAKSAENEMSAKDVAVVASKLVNDYPEVLKTTKETNAWFAKGTDDAIDMTTHNEMLSGKDYYMKDYNVDGLKTGTSNKAGNCFTGTVNKNGSRIITVVMHANGRNKADDRFANTQTIMKEVYTNFKPIRYKKGAQLKKATSFKVPEGKTTTVKAGISQPTTIWVANKQSKQSIRFTSKQSKKGLTAPVTKNQKIGIATAKVDGKRITYLQSEDAKLQVLAKKSVEKANIFVRMWRSVVSVF